MKHSDIITPIRRTRTAARMVSVISGFILLLFAVHAQSAHAGEGRIILRDGSVSCEGVSLWQRDEYRIFGRCGGLTYPYRERVDSYSLWVQPEEGGDPQRIAEIDGGFFEGRTNRRFTDVFVTAEEDGLPRTPSAVRIAAGRVQVFEFPETGSRIIVDPEAPPQVEPTPTPVPDASGGISTNLRRIGTLLLIVFVIIVGLVVVVPLLIRRP